MFKSFNIRAYIGNIKLNKKFLLMYVFGIILPLDDFNQIVVFGEQFADVFAIKLVAVVFHRLDFVAQASYFLSFSGSNEL